MEPEYVRSTENSWANLPSDQRQSSLPNAFPKNLVDCIGYCRMQCLDRFCRSFILFRKIALLFFIIAMVLWIFPACRPG